VRGVDCWLSWGLIPKAASSGARPRLAWLGLVTLLAVFATFLIRDVRNQGAHILAEARNFMACFAWTDEWTKDQTVRFLWNGRILHGYEFEVPRSGRPRRTIPVNQGSAGSSANRLSSQGESDWSDWGSARWPPMRIRGLLSLL